MEPAGTSLGDYGRYGDRRLASMPAGGGESRHSGMRVLVLVGLLLLLVAASGTLIALVASRDQGGTDLEGSIPFEHYLESIGLVARPAPGQPRGPVTVDRVAVDGEHTYVAYHLTEASSARTTKVMGFKLTAVPGGWLNTGSTSTCKRASGLLPDWLPFDRPSENCLAVYGTVPRATRVVLLQPWVERLPAGPQHLPPLRLLPAIKVPLNLRALAQSRDVPLHSRTFAGGVLISITWLMLWPVGGYLHGSIGVPASSLPLLPRAYLNGRAIAGSWTGVCGNDTCPVVWIVPPLAHGGSATLDIPEIDLSQAGRMVRVHGPFRLTFAVP